MKAKQIADSVVTYLRTPATRKFQFPKTLDLAVKPLLIAAVVVISEQIAGATVLDRIGSYIYGGFTGPLPKGLAVAGMVMGGWGLKHTEGRAHTLVLTTMIGCGAILAAPFIVDESSNTLSGILLAAPHVASRFFALTPIG